MRAAAKLYTGYEHGQVKEAYNEFCKFADVDWKIISDGFGLIDHETDLVPYECTLRRQANNKADYKKRADRLGIETAGLTIAELIAAIGSAKSIPEDLGQIDLRSYDAVYITLGKHYLRAIQPVLESLSAATPVYVFASRNHQSLTGGATVIPASERERRHIGAMQTRLKGILLKNLAKSIDNTTDLYDVCSTPIEVYARAILGSNDVNNAEI
ncbi:hypothetical protein [Halogranum rubrum]|uniref:hypothetical protein n=1 Tax=Halogranum rubrum TaxID=553466 RepID=UPI000677752B|nr:hypothetical protein [Halogranum salarium]